MHGVARSPGHHAKAVDVGRWRRAPLDGHLRAHPPGSGQRPLQAATPGGLLRRPRACSVPERHERAPLAPRKRACQRQSQTRAWPGRPGAWTAQSPARRGAKRQGCAGAGLHLAPAPSIARGQRGRAQLTASLTTAPPGAPSSTLSRMLEGVRSVRQRAQAKSARTSTHGVGVHCLPVSHRAAHLRG